MKDKYCRLCQTTKELKEFSLKNKERGIRQSYCKDCQNQRSRLHYKLNRDKYIKKARKRNSEVLGQIQKFVWDYLSVHPCVDCKESDIVVLEFDHISDKSRNLSELIRGRSSLATVKREVEKCVVRCANCHRRKTAKDFGWKKLILPR